MKKIFTLLICLAGMAISANATDVTSIRQCMEALLGDNSRNLMVTAPNMDANQDGIVNITDVTFMINQMLSAERASQAPRQDYDIEGLIHQVLENEETPTVDDVTDTINKKLEKK